MTKKRLTTLDLRTMLRKRYSGVEWALFEEVHDATGMYQRRSCDAMAMALWPSKGLELHGFELKVSRADWLHELRDPDKAEAFKMYCDRWWLVVSSKTIVMDSELPEGWGLMWARGGKLAISRGAAKLEPQEMDRLMLAGLLRRASEADISKAERRAIHDEAYKRGRASGKASGEANQVKHEALQKALSEFEAASGVKIRSYNGPELGAAVQAVLGLQGRWSDLGRLESSRESVVEYAQKLDAGLKALRKTAEACGLVRDNLPDEDSDLYLKKRSKKG